MTQIHPLKFAIIGDTNVGKSQLSARFTKDEYIENAVSTDGMQFSTKCLPCERCCFKAQIWDTAGVERVDKMSKFFYKDVVGVLLVYDITRRRTFDHIQSTWLAQLEQFGHPNVIKILVANKCDDNQLRQVGRDEGIEFAKQNGLCFTETSAKTGENVNVAFRRIIYSVGIMLHDAKIHLEQAGLPLGWMSYSSETWTAAGYNVNNLQLTDVDSSTSETFLNFWNGEFFKPESGESLKVPAPTFLPYVHNPNQSLEADNIDFELASRTNSVSIHMTAEQETSQRQMKKHKKKRTASDGSVDRAASIGRETHVMEMERPSPANPEILIPVTHRDRCCVVS